MKNLWNQFVLTVSRIDRRTIQIVLLVAMLVVMVLAAGAPDDGGTIIRLH